MAWSSRRTRDSSTREGKSPTRAVDFGLTGYGDENCPFALKIIPISMNPVRPGQRRAMRCTGGQCRPRALRPPRRSIAWTQIGTLRGQTSRSSGLTSMRTGKNGRRVSAGLGDGRWDARHLALSSSGDGMPRTGRPESAVGARRHRLGGVRVVVRPQRHSPSSLVVTHRHGQPDTGCARTRPQPLGR